MATPPRPPPPGSDGSAPQTGFPFGANPPQRKPNPNKVWVGASASASASASQASQSGTPPNLFSQQQQQAPGPAPSSSSSFRPPKPLFGNRSAVFNNGSASSSSVKASASTTPGLSVFAPSFTPSSSAASPPAPASAALAFVPSSVFAASSDTKGDAASTTTSSFGSGAGTGAGTSSAFGGFGTSAGQSKGFGAASTSTPSPGFGSTSTLGGGSSFGSAAPSTSAFGGKSDASSVFGSAGGTAGGSGGASTSDETSAFGGAGKSTSFGATTAPQPSFSFGSTPASTTAASSKGTFREPPTSSSSSSSSSAPPPASVMGVQKTMPAAEASSRFSAFMRPGSSLQTTSSNGAAGGSSVGSAAKNALGGSAKEDEERRKRFEDMPKENRFLELKAQREVLRAQYIKQGILPDPEKQLDLSQAQSLKGTCPTMCPEFEREEREFQNEGDDVEMFPGSNRIDPALAVKIYRRPAAGRELPLPEDVRPPPVLRRTLDYLFYSLMPTSPDSPTFTAVQGFLWNRTRAIRQDFIVQSERGALTIECHERIARFHILSVHWKGGPGNESWSEQQELEQLRKTIRSLTEFYDDLRSKNGLTSPNEGEFRAYNLLLHFRDPDTLREVEMLPAPIFDHPSVQAALRLREVAQRSNNAARRAGSSNTEATLNMWSRFFGELKSNKDVNYLMACLAENLFNSVRLGALKAMSNTYLVQHNPLPIEYIARSLGMDDTDEAADFVRKVAKFEEVWREGGPGGRSLVGFKVCKGALHEDKTLPSPFSQSIVEAKRGSHSAQDIVDGRASGAVPLLTELEGENLESAVAALRKPNAALQKASAAVAKLSTPTPTMTTAPKSVSFAPNLDVAPTPPPVVESPAGEKPSAFGAPASRTSAFGGAAKTSAFGVALGESSAFKTPTSSSAFGSALGGAKKDTPAPSTSAAPGFSFAPAAASSPAFGLVKSTPSTEPSAPAAQKESKPFSFAPSAPTSKPSEPVAQPTKVESKSEAAIPTFFGQKEEEKKKSEAAATKPLAPILQPKTSSAESKTKELPAAAAPEPAVEVKPVPQVKAEVKSKRQTDPRASAKKMTDHAMRQVVPDAVQRLAIEALEAEAKRRRNQARVDLLSRLAKSLTAAALKDVVDRRVQRLCASTLARRISSSALRGATLCKWRKRLAEEREMKLQARRLVEVREKLQRRAARYGNGVGARAGVQGEEGKGWARRSIIFGERRLAKSASLKNRAYLSRSSRIGGGEADMDAVMDDTLLSHDFQAAAELRQSLWAEGTFFETIVGHVDFIVTPAVTGFSVGFSPSTMPRDGATSLWLGMKLHLNEERHAEVQSDAGVLVHAVRLDEGDEEALEELDEEDDLGLVLFECSPELARGEASFIEDLDAAWGEERKRLEDLAGRRGVRRSRFVPSLLLIDWHPSTNAEAAETKRKELFRRLGLTATSELRSAWSNVGLLEVDAALAADTDVDEVFARSVRGVLPGLAWNSARRTMSLASVGEALARPCQEIGMQLDGVMARARTRRATAAAASLGSKETQALQHLARTSLEMCVALVNLAMRCLIDVSDLIVEDSSSLELPPLRAWQSQSANDGQLDETLFNLAISYLDDASFDNEEERDLAQHLRLRFVELQASSSAFPISEFLTSLLRLVIARCEPHWLSALDGAESVLASHAANLSSLGARGVGEILGLVPSPSQAQAPAQAQSPRKRSALPPSPDERRAKASSDAVSSPSKRPRSALAQSTAASHHDGSPLAQPMDTDVNVATPKTKAVGSLREAMDAARALLSGVAHGEE